MRTTNSHVTRRPFFRRLAYLWDLFGHNRRLLWPDRVALSDEANQYIQQLTSRIARARQLAGVANPDSLRGVRLLEIGCGQRCLAGLILHSLGVRYTGIDLDVPTYRITPRVAWAMLRANGAFRLTKAITRHALFDRSLFGAYDRALRDRGTRLNRKNVDTRTTSAEAVSSWHESFDVIYSYDVFEHIPASVLPAVVEALMSRLTPSGCCLIRLNPFPGISGGHLPEWYDNTLGDLKPRRVPAWEHLRDGEGATGDTFLNGLSHADYLRLFEASAEMVAHFPDDQLGQPFLTQAVQREFPQFSAEQLCATGWSYVLRQKKTAGALAAGC